ncbi:MAG TPA: hypothetical protein VET85_13510 [Stellaceae bacterium]|nr:hypothetical protein [Stellaceae bacterium]
METLVKLAFTIAAGTRAATSFGDHARGFAITVVGIVCVGILVAASIGCAAASLWIFAIPYVGSAGAPLCMAAVFLAGGFAVLAYIRHVRRGPRLTQPSKVTPETVLADAVRLLGDNKGATLMTAFVAGLAAGSDKR